MSYASNQFATGVSLYWSFSMQFTKRDLLLIFFAIIASVAFQPALNRVAAQDPKAPLNSGSETIRFASFNISFYRSKAGELKQELSDGTSAKPKKIAEIIQRVRPDVILLNEFDYDAAGKGIDGFQTNYLGISQNGNLPIHYRYAFSDAVNTGVDSKQDLDSDGSKNTANDAFGFGNFPGQYGMVVLSKFKIPKTKIRTFRNFLWKDMPSRLVPRNNDQQPFYSPEVMELFRLSSKSHWDIPIRTQGKTIHFLVAHPTPPVFDGPEDRNGCRNHDEIKFFSDYVTEGMSKYIYDDNGQKGGLSPTELFVIAGDMNADENDGDSTANAACLLTNNPRINNSNPPKSSGGKYYSQTQGGVNLKQKGNAEFDTSDFGDSNVGNLRLDYCLPSANLKMKSSGVFWPKPSESGANLIDATDHRLVWLDLQVD